MSFASFAGGRRRRTGGSAPAPYVPVVTNIVITGTSTGIVTHTTAPYAATVFDQGGHVMAGVPLTWASSSPSVATIDQLARTASCLTAGTTSITASASGVTSNAITLTSAAQVATSPIVVSPDAFPFGIGETQALTATVYDQGVPALPISGATVSWASGTPGVATVNSGTGVVTGVGVGEAIITATRGSATGTSTATVSAPSPVVNTVTVSPTTFTLGVSATQQLTATVKDQYGSAMPSETVTWGSSNTGLATVSNTGLVTAVANGSVTITATSVTDNTKTGTSTGTISALNPTTGAFVMGSNGATPLSWGWFDLYTSDSQYRSTSLKLGDTTPYTTSTAHNYIYSTPALNGGLTSGYQYYGIMVDLATIVTSAFTGAKVLRCRYVGENLPRSCPDPEIVTTLPAGSYTSLWVGRRITHLLAGDVAGQTQNWTYAGDADNTACGLTFNTGGTCGGVTYVQPQNQALKTGTFVGYSNYDGRAGIETANGSQYDNNVTPLSKATGQGVGGATIRAVGATSIDAALTDRAEYDEVEYLEGFTSGGTNYTACTWYRRKVGTTTWVRVGARLVGPMNAGLALPLISTVTITSKNYNQSRKTDLYRDVPGYAVFNPDAGGLSADPWGILAQEASDVPLPPVSVVKTVQDSSSATFTMARTSSLLTASITTYIRPVIDGVEDATQDYTIPRTAADTDTLTIPVTLSLGAHTVAFKGVNANKSQVSTTSAPTPALSVTIVAIPGVPSVSNATSQTSNSLSFPVTLNASGALPTALAVRYSTNGGSSWTSGSDITLSSPSLGQSITAVVLNLPTVSQLYTVQLAEKNLAGTSAWSSSATGTTAGAPSPAYNQGFDFRNTLAYVTDVSPNVAVIAPNNTATPSPYSAGVGYGFTVAFSSADNGRNRSTTVDKRLAGCVFQANTGTRPIFRIDVPAAGTYDVRLALGDATFAQNNCTVEFLDGSTSLFTVTGTMSSGGKFFDATGTEYSSANWPTSNTPRQITLTGTALNIKLGTSTNLGSTSPLAHVSLVRTS